MIIAGSLIPGLGAIGAIIDAAPCGDCSDCTIAPDVEQSPVAFAPALRGGFPPPPALSPALLRQERRAVARRYPAGSPAVCAKVIPEQYRCCAYIMPIV